MGYKFSKTGEQHKHKEKKNSPYLKYGISRSKYIKNTIFEIVSITAIVSILLIYEAINLAYEICTFIINFIKERCR